MEQFFEDTEFIQEFSKLLYNKIEILNIMKKMKKEDPELEIYNFICIIHKIIHPDISKNYSWARYMLSVQKWNDYNYKQHNFSIMISSHNLAF